MTGTLPDLSRASLDEIIFEGRNQEYGAFDLRRSYDRHLKQALGVAIALLLLLMVTPAALRLLHKDDILSRPTTQTDDTVYTLVELPPLEQLAKPKPQVAPPPSTPVNSTAHVPPRIVTDQTPEAAHLTTMDEANKATNLGTTTVTDGTDTAPAVVDGPAVVAPPVEDAGKVWEYAEEPAEYPGGQQALLKFVAKNTHFNGLALRNQVEGRVFLRFVVNESGDVTNATVVKGIGAGLDEEALRVVQLLHFKPARQNGHPVKVYFSLPITFRIQ